MVEGKEAGAFPITFNSETRSLLGGRPLISCFHSFFFFQQSLSMTLPNEYSLSDFYSSDDAPGLNQLDVDEKDEIVSLEDCDVDWQDTDTDELHTPRRLTEAFLPSSGPVRSSPIVGNLKERRAHRREKAQRKRRTTVEGHQQAAKAEKAQREHESLD